MDKTEKNIISTIISPFQRFFKIEAAGGMVLLFFTLIAILWANSGFGNYYIQFWNTDLSLRIGNFSISDSLLNWINDGLMAIFFFVVGLEVKREFKAGELSNTKQALLPVFAAIGGMIVPGSIYLFMNNGTPYVSGWGIPMATDITLSLGVLSLMGKRVPLGLKVFLVAFAIVDNLVAVLSTAFFYSSGIQINYLFIGVGLYLYLILFNFFKIRMNQPYMIFGWIIWYMFLKSGIHPAVAGVLIAFTIPVGKKIRVDAFKKSMEENLKVFRERGHRKKEFMNDDQLAAIDNMESETKKVQSPLQSLQLKLHGFVTYLVLPLFALANAGIILGADSAGEIVDPLGRSIGISLVAGKLAGIVGFSYLSVKLGLTVLPDKTKWIHILGVSLLGGIGCTMSLFVSNLVFNNEVFLNASKTGIYTGSVVAGIMGFIILRLTLKKETVESVSIGKNEGKN